MTKQKYKTGESQGRTGKVILAVMIGPALTVPAVFAAEPKFSGFLGDYYKNLQPKPKDGAKMCWLKQGIDFGKYNKFMVHNVVFYCADDSSIRYYEYLIGMNSSNEEEGL